MKWIRKIWTTYVVWKYEQVSLDLGNADSYMIACGPCVGRETLVKRQKKWERRYESLGYKPIDMFVWQDAGGWGHEYKHLLFQPK